MANDRVSRQLWDKMWSVNKIVKLPNLTEETRNLIIISQLQTSNVNWDLKNRKFVQKQGYTNTYKVNVNQNLFRKILD